MIFYEKLKSEIEAEESEFPAIEEQIRVLDKYQVELDDKLRLKQQNIMQVWKNYLSMLDESLIMLNNTKVCLAVKIFCFSFSIIIFRYV